MYKQIKKMYERAVLSGGEKYLPIDELQDYIKTCNTLGIAIIAVDLFMVKGKSVQPLEALSGFDASILFDEKQDKFQNVTSCNSFILNCYEKSRYSLQGFYFTSVVEYEELF